MKAVSVDIARAEGAGALQESRSLGLLKRGGRIHAMMVPDAGSAFERKYIRAQFFIQI